jgi:hypothetical protein
MDLELLRETPPWEWPGNTGDTFLKLLTDKVAKPADRLTAADLAGDFTVINDDLAHVLLAILQDPRESEELRGHAAISFGAAMEAADEEYDEEIEGFQDDEMVPISDATFLEIRDSLRALYADTGVPKLVRRRVLEAAVRAPEQWQQDAIRDAYASGDPEWVLTAVFGMRFVDGFEDEIMESLESRDPLIHFQAVVAAGEQELDAAWPHVLKLVKDPRTEKDLRVAAIGAIGSIRPNEAQGILFALTESTDELIADAAEEALSYIVEPDEDEEDEEEDDEDEDEEDDEKI